MKSCRRMAVALVVLLATILPTLALAERGPSTPEERAKAVKLARELEANPLGEHAQEDRKWLLQWIEDVPDITVNICPAILTPLTETSRNFAHEIWLQTMFSSAAFIIEHPQQTADETAVYSAGVEGALKAYESILKVRPQARWAYLDDLIQKRDKGELTSYIRGKVNKECSPERQPA